MRIVSNLIRLISFVCLLSSSCHLWATHNRAAEITYEQIGELTIRITITTYTRTSSPADRDSLIVLWGDGSESTVERSNGNGLQLANNIKLNFYVAEHTYPGRASYTISFTDENRIGNILNIDPPNSINVPIHVRTTFTFLSPQFQGVNNSAILLQPPIDFACVGQKFVHNPNAFDPDGDSLSYSLVVPFQDVNTEVPNYLFPDQIQAGPANRLTLDPVSGTLTWNAPQIAGEYNIAIQINEYRNGVLLNSIVRDMQIFVENCSNIPPEIDAIDEICVLAEEEAIVSVRATDKDLDQKVQLTALGGPFESLYSMASFEVPAGFADHPVDGIFRWTPSCNDISDQFYTVVFRASDNFFDSTGLVDLHTMRVKVVGPPPQDLQVENQADAINVSWSTDYSCKNAADNFFKGFTVWRREGTNPFLLDTCDTDIRSRGYVPIAFSVNDIENGRYSYTDENVDPNIFYCYRVTATFAQTTTGGNAFNTTESLPSNEDCADQLLDRPRITKVSVLSTDENSGSVEINWSIPIYPDLDTIAFPGPYQIQLLHAEGFGNTNFQLIPEATITAPTLSELVDTAFIHENINTQAGAHEYQVSFATASRNLDPPMASSLFLTVQGADQRNILSWRADVPWQNYVYRVFRENNGVFEFIGQSTSNSYVDNGLTNGTEYCYYIESEGTYGFDGIISPIINLSQESCGIPEDNEPPCSPDVTVDNNCIGVVNVPSFSNVVRWTLNGIDCDPSDVNIFHVYYLQNDSSEAVLLESLGPGAREFTHRSNGAGLAGCYYVTAEDSIGNESIAIDTICAPVCPLLRLPNAFTPNNDGDNDLFIPSSISFIASLDFQVFNRWGEKVFETNDVNINWNGENMNGKELAEGTYYYICTFLGISESVPTANNVLKGNIQLLR